MIEDGEEQPATDRTGTVVSGTRWGVLTQVATQASRFGVSIVLARLLVPADFGIVTLGLTFVLFLDVFKDMGTTAAIVQRKAITEELLSTLFWINAVIGGALFGLMAAAAPTLSAIADGGAEGSRLLTVLGLVLPVSSLRLVQEGLIRRRFQYGRLASINLSVAVVSGVLSVATAAFGAGAWSLVIGQIGGAVIATVIAWTGTGWRPSWCLRWSEARSVAGFSLNLTFFNLFNFFFLHSDKLLVGRFLGASALGVYGLGQRILMGPTRSISQMIQQVLFPTFARLQDDHRAMARGYLRACAAIALVTFPTLTGLAVVADPFIHVVVGPKWQDAVPIVAILAPIGALHSLHFTVGAIYSATGRTDLLFRWGVGSGVATVVAYVIGLRWGLVGVASAYAVVVGLLTWPAFAIPFRLIGIDVRELVVAVVPAIGGTAATVAAAAGVQWWLGSAGAGDALVLLGAGGAGGLAYATFLFVVRPPALGDLARVAGGRRRQPAPDAISRATTT